ncbi:MAG: tRNA (adenosine(37)-N6)-threonylcarbamoyltransferase complex ATPase subunit type 1 TsaE [Candidatus Colwellbacteria bacterium RIFCSPLOWO2_01_FULL_48_10]|uniref:tRNA threonylcarbamoyladenosine biosynthesis protein TsaE n=1 Tax=Candidatus Colwellbacteria bacterium RIFCSPLOWO2_01_FULL_48_10 TaxID=1797690 RepID=A0A1G1Z426_9BACT|nr:MAG: tRNA (adenosine(37)-N6)-threonylcarbamoyltransferase complex ATPase subunit type 1 TsaE [Candidatus Colwellbacteria bacterium RIFCSPLOWO2_01_FULL_48_10]
MAINKLLKSPRETAALARTLAQVFMYLGPSHKGATVVGLVGDLGAGKTSFTKTFLRTFGVKTHVVSPTFVIMRSFALPARKRNGFRAAHHVDAYRIDARALKQMNFGEYLADSRNIILIEWADRIKKALPKSTFWIEMGHGRHHKERIFSLKFKD